MEIPSNVSTGRVTGQFIVGVTDGDDADQNPDVIPATGFVTFTASVPYLPDPTASPNPVTILQTSIVAVLDSEGYLCTPLTGSLDPGYRGVRLFATDDPDVSVVGWTWTATYKFATVSGTPLAIPTHSFAVPSDGAVDLTTVIKVPSSTGIGTEQAEALAASAQAAAVAAAASAAAAAGSAAVTDSNIADLVATPATDTASAVQAIAEAAAAPKLDADDAATTYQTLDGLDANVSVTAGTNGTSLNTTVKGLANAAAAGKLDASQKGAASGVATLDSASKIPVAQVPDAVKPDNSGKPVGKGELVLNVKDYGAKGDGTTDDTAAINAALTAAAGKTLVFPTATYKISDTLTVPSGTTVDGSGSTLDATTMPVGTAFGQRLAILSQGTLGSTAAITGAIAQWSRTITGIASTAGLAPGDVVLVQNTEQPVPGMTRTDRLKGELRTILTVDSATQLTLTGGSILTYTTAGLVLQKMTPVRNVTLKNFTLQMGGIGAGHNGIRFAYGRDITVSNVKIDGAEDIALTLNTVLNGRVTGCKISNSTNPSYTTSGYGISVVDGSQHVTVDNNYLYNCRHLVAGGGRWPAMYVNITDNHGEKSTNGAYDCHEPAFYWTFKNNTIIGCYGGFLIRGQYVTVESNYVADCTGKAYEVVTVDGVTEQRGIRIINNRALKAALAGIWVDGKAAGAEPDSRKYDLEIRGNTLRDCGTDTIVVRNFDGANVSNNTIYTPTRHGILALGTAAGTPSQRLTIDGNTIVTPGGDGVQAQYVDGITGIGGLITNAALFGYEFLTCNRTRLTGVTVRASVRSGIYLSAGAIHTVTGATVTEGTDAGYDALRGAGASDITVTGGYYAGPRSGVATTGGDRVIITGVNATGAVSATKISSDATSKVLANNLP